MLILLWILYVTIAAIAYAFFWHNVSKQWIEDDFVVHGMIAICAISWPLVAVITLMDSWDELLDKFVDYMEEESPEPQKILVPVETWGLTGNHRYEPVVAYLVGKTDEEPFDRTNAGFAGCPGVSRESTPVHHIENDQGLRPIGKGRMSSVKVNPVRKD
jgi:hypothetical protein